jgi:hypothetical protein
MLACPCRAKNAGADSVPRVYPSATMEEAFQAKMSKLQSADGSPHLGLLPSKLLD